MITPSSRPVYDKLIALSMSVCGPPFARVEHRKMMPGHKKKMYTYSHKKGSYELISFSMMYYSHEDTDTHNAVPLQITSHKLGSGTRVMTDMFLGKVRLSSVYLRYCFQGAGIGTTVETLQSAADRAWTADEFFFFSSPSIFLLHNTCQ